jgi:hypothetical protein
MTDIQSVILQAWDPAAAEEFYATAFGLGDRLLVHAADAPTSGFRGFMLSLVVAQPNIVDTLIDAAAHGGATTLKPAQKSFWGYGGVMRAPDGAIWKIASSAKKNSGPATREIDDFVLLLGATDVKAAKAVLRRPRPARRQKLRQQVRRVRRGRIAGEAGAVQPPGRGEGCRCLRGRHRLAPDRYRRRQ